MSYSQAQRTFPCRMTGTKLDTFSIIFKGLNDLYNEMRWSKLSFLFHELKNTLFYGDIMSGFCLHRCQI
jgi:hypothetical protein